MINAEISLTLGYSLVDGSPVALHPNMGPLTVYGDVGSGKTVAARSLFGQLAANSEIDGKPVVAIDGSQQGYADIAREYGGTSVTVSPEKDLQIPGTEDNPAEFLEHHSILTMDASALSPALIGRDTDPANRNGLRRMLEDCLLQGPTAHIVVDPIDHLLTDHACTDLLLKAMTEAIRQDTLLVCVVCDPAMVAKTLNLDAQVMLNRGSTLLMGSSHNLRRKDGIFDLIDPLMFELAANCPLGYGLFSTPTGGLTNLAISEEQALPGAPLSAGTS